MNEKGAITKAASTNERLRTVKDKTSVQLFIVALICKCKTFVWYNFCANSVAVACELNIWFDSFVEVSKKHRHNVGKKEICRQQLSLTFQQKRKA